jgi:hypothetical protein
MMMMIHGAMIALIMLRAPSTSTTRQRCPRPLAHSVCAHGGMPRSCPTEVCYDGQWLSHVFRLWSWNMKCIVFHNPRAFLWKPGSHPESQ